MRKTTRVLTLSLSLVLFMTGSALAQTEANAAETDGQDDAAAKAAKAAAAASASQAKSTASEGSVSSETAGHELQPNWNMALGPTAKVGYPWVEHHGNFRFRGDLFYQFDLGTYDSNTRRGSSPFNPPLTTTDNTGNQLGGSTEHRYREDGKSLSSANIRFRYNPTLHVSEDLRIRTTLDILDNLVLGSTPDGGPHTLRALGPDADILGRADVPIEAFEDAQRPPEAGVNGWRDGLRVRRLWAEWRTPLGLISAGRMPNHWGLGILANSGDCLDCDFGDSVDRVMGVMKIFDTYLAISWDFPAEGAIGMSGTQDLRNQASGQPYDLDQRDDVNQFVIALFDKPQTRDELQERARALSKDGTLTLDWGIYSVIRTQSLESTFPADSIPVVDAEGVQLYEIDAFTFTPDVWIDLQYRVAANQTYRLQFEAALTTGSIEEVPQLFHVPTLDGGQEACVDPTDDPETCTRTKPRYRDVLRFGYALEFDATVDEFEWGLHHGLATGDARGAFGRLSDSEIPSVAPVGAVDETLTTFYFDRDYHVDLILFRELLGGVTNATYFKPYLRYNFINDPALKSGVELAVIYGYALESGPTPGQSNSLGTEFDLELYLIQRDQLRWSLAYGVLFPMGAFDTPYAEASAAQTLQLMFGIEF